MFHRPKKFFTAAICRSGYCLPCPRNHRHCLGGADFNSTRLRSEIAGIWITAISDAISTLSSTDSQRIWGPPIIFKSWISIKIWGRCNLQVCDLGLQRHLSHNKGVVNFVPLGSLHFDLEALQSGLVSGPQKGPAERATSKNVRNRQKVSKTFSTLLDNFRAGQKKAKIVKRCQKYFRLPLQFQIFDHKVFHADFLLTGEINKLARCTLGFMRSFLRGLFPAKTRERLPNPRPCFRKPLQFGNFRPGASFTQNTFSGHATDFFIRRDVLGQKSSILKNLHGNWCEYVFLVFFWLFWHLPKHCTGHLGQSMDGSDEAYTLQAESRYVQVCVIFGQKLALQEFLGRLGRFSGRS